MENKPVIILGGGLWGGLLAYRMKQLQPEVTFKLYERGSSFGGNHTWSFHESDLPTSSLKWLEPFIEKSWDGHDLYFPSISRHCAGRYHSITSDRFHKILSQTLSSDEIRLNNEVSLDIAISESQFVIDARNTVSFEQAGFQKFYGVEVELEEAHNLERPILMDALVEQKDGYRFFYYLPWDKMRVLIEDTRYSSNSSIDLNEFKIDVSKRLKEKGWIVKRIVREEHGVLPIPLTAGNIHEKDKVVNIGGIFHDTTGYSLPDAVRLIERMILSSFRYGELREVTKKFRDEREDDRKFFRLLNRLMFSASEPSERFRIFQHFYHLPDPLIQRFYRGEMKTIDRARIFLGKPPVPVIKAMQIFLPESYSGKVVTQ